LILKLIKNMKYTRWQISIRVISVVAGLCFSVLTVRAQADAFLPPIGGSGGGQFIARCNADQYLTGFQLRTADDVDAIRPLCVSIYGPTEVGPADPFRIYLGGDGGSKRDLVCPSNTPIVIGMEIEYEGYETEIVNKIHLFCGLASATVQVPGKFPSAAFDGPRAVNPGGVHFNAPILLSQRCPDGYIALGITGRSGIWLDAVGLICGVPRFTPNPHPAKSLGRIQPPKSLGRVNLPGRPAFIYGLANDGTLNWYRHDGAKEGKFDWEGPRVVNLGWNNFKQVFPGGNGIIYAITSQGSLMRYQHTGFNTGLGKDDNGAWLPAQQIATGWGNVTHAFSEGSGIIYAITGDGRLWWFRHTGFDGDRAIWEGPKDVGRGWGDLKQVFSMGEGIIYTISYDGKLNWYRHNGYMSGAGLDTPGSWTGPKQVGTGWGELKQVFSTGDGIIYGITPEGKLMWRRHRGFRDGTFAWEGPAQVGTGWGNLFQVFAQP
jgi:hypothetical protein